MLSDYHTRDKTRQDKTRQVLIKYDMILPVPIVRAGTDVLNPAGDVSAAFPLGTLQVPDIVDLTGFVIPQALLPEPLSLYWPASNVWR